MTILVFVCVVLVIAALTVSAVEAIDVLGDRSASGIGMVSFVVTVMLHVIAVVGVILFGADLIRNL